MAAPIEPLPPATSAISFDQSGKRRFLARIDADAGGQEARIGNREPRARLRNRLLGDNPR